METLDPELSSSTGLTNHVAGRLSIFDPTSRNEAPGDCASAQPTPSKEDPSSKRVALQKPFEDVIIKEEGAELDMQQEGANDETAQKRDAFLATLAGMSKDEKKMRIGEKLYHAIAEKHGMLAGKLTGMFLEATENQEDLALLIFSPASLDHHLGQALEVLNASTAADAPPVQGHADDAMEPSQQACDSEKSDAPSPDAAGAKRLHPRGGPQQFPYNGKRARTSSAWDGKSETFFAVIVDDAGKRTRVPCKYDVQAKMFVPSGGRDVAPGGKVGTREKTAEDLQALPLGEEDEERLRARQKQIEIGKNTEGYRRLRDQHLSGRELQELLALPYITEEGVLELTLKCSKKRYDGYLRMWKRKLYEFAGLQRIDFRGFPPIEAHCPATAAPEAGAQAAGAWKQRSAAAGARGQGQRSGRKQTAPTRHVAAAGGTTWATRVASSSE